MDTEKRKALEAAGWSVGSASDFLGLTPEETIECYGKLAMSNRDEDRFLAGLDRPAKPLPALVKAKRLHTQATKGE